MVKVRIIMMAKEFNLTVSKPLLRMVMILTQDCYKVTHPSNPNWMRCAVETVSAGHLTVSVGGQMSLKAVE